MQQKKTPNLMHLSIPNLMYLDLLQYILARGLVES